MDRIKPEIRLLKNDDINKIHKISLKILAETGIRIYSAKALSFFKKHSDVKINQDVIKIGPELVNEAIESTPPIIDIYGRTGDLKFRLGKNEKSRFGIGVTNLYWEDPASGEFLEFTRELIAKATLLGHRLDGFDLISTPGIIRDIPADQTDIFCTLEMLANTTKPLILLISNPKQLENVIHMAHSLVDDLKNKPCLIPYFNPKTPLVYDKGTLENILFSVEFGLPVIISNYGMMGSTTPASSYKTLALLNAELLAGLVFCHLIKHGAPVVLGSLPAVFDIKNMTSYYDPQSIMLNIASAEMMENYQIPHCGTSGSGIGWRADLKTSGLLWMNHLTSILGKAGLIPFIGGNFDSLVFSPTTVVYANKMISRLRELENGLMPDQTEKVIEEIKSAGVGGDFFTSEDTLKHMMDYSEKEDKIWPSMSLENWIKGNKPEASDLLKDYTINLLKESAPPADHDEIIEKGKAYIKSI